MVCIEKRTWCWRQRSLPVDIPSFTHTQVHTTYRVRTYIILVFVGIQVDSFHPLG